MKKTIPILVMVMLCLNFHLKAQTINELHGTVTNSENQPLAGATIKIKSIRTSTTTNNNGQFIFHNISYKTTLQISYMGYESVEIKASARINVILKKSNSNLDEIQIIAYGSTTRRLNTGSISSIKAKDIESQPVSNPLAALQGRIPGMIISQTSGLAGSTFNVQIRGQSSLDLNLSQNNPLFIIDGVPFESGNSPTNRIASAANSSSGEGGLSPLNTINPQDIESIDVLKDADATSIYGSRGANGVILITTKKGKTGGTKFGVSMYTGISRVGRTMDMLKTKEYVQLRREAFANEGIVPSANPTDKGYAPDIMVWDTTRYTDFKKLLIGNTAHTNHFQTSVSGGNNMTQFLIGANYHRETTVFSSSSDFSDAISSLNFNISHSTANQKFKLTLGGRYASDNNKLPGTDFTRYINLPPNLRLSDEVNALNWEDQGTLYYTLGNGDIINPLSLLKQEYNSLNENLSGNLQLSYQVLPKLSIKANLGYTSFNSDEKYIKPKTSIDPNIAAFGILPSAAFASSTNRNWIIEPQAEYHLEARKSKLTILIGNTLQSKTTGRSLMEGNNYNSDLLLNSISAAGTITASNDQVQYRYTAFFGRINYNYTDKYIFNFSARRDGSSRFGPDQQWANFGAIGLAWLFFNEAFIQNNITCLSYGKLRGSYGTTGNDQIGDYKFLNLWSSTAYPYNGTSGLLPKNLFNPDYNWEINKKFEVAVELGFLKDRIMLTTAYYNNRCNNQLINYTLPSQSGFFQVVKNFPGLVENSGIELSITTQNISSKSFNWFSSFNLSIPQNKLISFPNLSSSSYKSRYIEGKSLNLIQALRYTGVNTQTGVYTFEDLNKDGLLTSADYQLFGNKDSKFYGGLQNNIRFQKFDLSFFFQFTKQTGLNYINQLSSSAPGKIYNQPIIIRNRWQQAGDVSDIQKLAAIDGPVSGALGYLRQSNGLYTDASFVRLKNVSLSYRLSDHALRWLAIRECRLYLEAQNLMTISNYKGADPENQNFYSLPPLKTIVCGIQLNF